ncbi:MAG TPA: acetyl-CoA carboxylase biotin carboxyl carrier protein subunit [Bacteroidales bacterium]|nr:acetyl-CoA carboxylase biotin carboxyl carrier protein subunit [Bacteroidales bacterium]
MEKDEKPEYLNINSSLYQTRLSKKFRERKNYAPADPKIILSFIPGTVLEIFVKEGQGVKKGDNLLILDAMKMQNRLKCSMDGKIKSIKVQSGDKVPKGVVLLELE